MSIVECVEGYIYIYISIYIHRDKGETFEVSDNVFGMDFFYFQ